MLQGFADKDMIEQIVILDELKESGQIDALPALLELYADSEMDQAVDEMVYHTIFDLMAGQAQAVAEGLKSDSSRIQFLCIRRAGDDGDSQIQPALIDLLTSCEDSEMISEIIRALGGFDDPSLTDVLLPYLEHEDDAIVAWTMHSLIKHKTDQGRFALQSIVQREAAEAEQTGDCDLRTAQAISNIAGYRDAAAADFLVSYIHHSSATFRRVVISSLPPLALIYCRPGSIPLM